jgi:ubiquinone/menaquinone biosynthesis C-methylase UbiE
MEGLHAELARRIPESGCVLDLGCGTNRNLARYRSPQRQVWGVDFDAHSRLHDAKWFRPLLPGGSIPFPDATFDVAAAIMVLEHIASPEEFLREVQRVLRPGGYFVAHSISSAHYVTWIRRLVGLLPHSFNQWLVHGLFGRVAEDTFPAFYRINNRRRIERACRSAGFKMVHLARYADVGYFRFWRPLTASAVVADRALEMVAPGWGRLYFTVTLQKDR